MLKTSICAHPSSAFGVGVSFGLCLSDKGDRNKKSLPVPSGPHRIAGVCVQRIIDKANNYFLIFHVPVFVPNSCIDLWNSIRCLNYYGPLQLFFIKDIPLPGCFSVHCFPSSRVSGEKSLKYSAS